MPELPSQLEAALYVVVPLLQDVPRLVASGLPSEVEPAYLDAAWYLYADEEFETGQIFVVFVVV